MAKNTVPLAVAAGAFVVAPAFLPTGGVPSRPSSLSIVEAGRVGGSPLLQGSTTVGLSAAAVVAIGAAGVAASKAVVASRPSRTANTKVSMNVNAGRAEDPPPVEEDPYAAYRKDLGFAGGLIGGASAFSSFDYNFDPLNISERCFQYLPWFREAELKHGRVAMLAWVGLVVPDIVRLPVGEVPGTPCYTAQNVVEAHNMCVAGPPVPLGSGGPLWQVFLFCGLIEFFTTFPKCVDGLSLETAGDYRLGLNFLPKDEIKAQEMKLKELKNGRLAMLAFGGAITQAALSGNGFPWVFAEGARQCVGLTSSVPKMKPSATVGSSRIAMRAEPTVYGGPGGYKMSKSVPFLPVSPALEGYVGEEDGFDPMGFTLALDIRWLREAELKHARVAMLATTGWIATDLGMRVPGAPFQVSTMEAHDAMVKFGSMPQMLIWMGYLELFGFLAIVNMMEYKTDRKPGDFGLRTLYPDDEAGQYEMQLKELRNGRLAMLAFGGIVTSAVLTGKTWPFFATANEGKASSFGGGAALCGGLQRPTSSRVTSMRALEASKSLPFLPKPSNLEGYVGAEVEFDPLGFSDTFDIKWMREAELKHGRVCMLAAVGFFAQQYITFPGMTPTPNALDSLYTAPAGATASLLFLAGYIESASYNGKITMLDMFEGNDRVPGDFNFGAGFLRGKTEQEIYDLKLKELNNGRLAMFALGGMVHHNLVVSGPLFPLFPDGWVGPQGTWNYGSFIGDIVNGKIGNEVVPP